MEPTWWRFCFYRNAPWALIRYDGCIRISHQFVYLLFEGSVLAGILFMLLLNTNQSNCIVWVLFYFLQWCTPVFVTLLFRDTWWGLFQKNVVWTIYVFKKHLSVKKALISRLRCQYGIMHFVTLTTGQMQWVNGSVQLPSTNLRCGGLYQTLSNINFLS